MIMMTEQEARSTIELYENTFGKELRRRTFRTWNDWAKAEQEFTPKDGSLQYVILLSLFPSFQCVRLHRSEPTTVDRRRRLTKSNE